LVAPPTPTTPIPPPPPLDARQDDDWFNLQVGIESSQFNIYHPANAFAAQIEKVAFTGASLTGQYAYFWGGSVLVTGTFGIERGNNYADLNSVQIDQQTVTTSGATTRTIKDTVTAKSGNYVESTTVPLRLDVFWQVAPTSTGPDRFLTQRLGVNGFIHGTAAA